MDSTELSGGMLSAWNPKKDVFSSFLTPTRIMLDGFFKDLDRSMKLIHCYGLYSDREVFWEAIKREGIFNEQNLILGGDLNFTTSIREVWGAHAREDPLLPFFSQLIQDEGLANVEPLKFLPTWRNLRVGEAHVAKILDHYLIIESMSKLPFQYRQWIGSGGESNHSPVWFVVAGESDHSPVWFAVEGGP